MKSMRGLHPALDPHDPPHLHHLQAAALFHVARARSRSPSGVADRHALAVCSSQDDPTRARVPSLILAAILILIGVQLWIFGVVADVIAVNRKLLEDIQLRVQAHRIPMNHEPRTLRPRSSRADSEDPDAAGSQRTFADLRLFRSQFLALQDHRFPERHGRGVRLAARAGLHAADRGQPVITSSRRSRNGWRPASSTPPAARMPMARATIIFPLKKPRAPRRFRCSPAWKATSCSSLHNAEMLDFFSKRADWLADHHESGRLTNHQALIVLCLEKAGRLVRQRPLGQAQSANASRACFEWQNEEGWFQEYEGCDPGYHTLTIGAARAASRARRRPPDAQGRAAKRRSTSPRTSSIPTARSAANTPAATPTTFSRTASRLAGQLAAGGAGDQRPLPRRPRRTASARVTPTTTSSATTPGAICSPTQHFIAERPAPAAHRRRVACIFKTPASSSSAAATACSTSR